MRTLLAALLLAGSTALAAETELPKSIPNLNELKKMSARFAPVKLTADVKKLPENEQRALAKLIEASRIIDALYLRQISAENPAWLLELSQDRTPLGQARLDSFILNKGPWSRLDHDAPILAGVGPKAPQANFYPAGATREEVEAWIKSLAGPQQQAATGFFTTIRRLPDGKLTAVPYSVEYQGEVARMAELLQEAAKLTTQPTLKSFLEKRAAAFLSNDYYASDLAWMELDASIEPTIGPYEVYEDEWFNYKAAFESFITLRDDAETAKLQKFSSELQDIENNLPIDPKYRNPKLGALAPIRVVNSVFSAGDANRGVQTAAFNLPNDERVAKEKGTKRVMLKNVQEAKFQKVLVPIAKIALVPGDVRKVQFDPFFTHILMHELMHGLGPHSITVDGRETTVRQELQNAYSALEEAKADVSGLFALQHLMDKGVLPKAQEESMYVTFLASGFRTIRFGLNEAHGKGMAVQINYFLDQGAYTVDAQGRFKLNLPKMKEAVRSLTREFMHIQAEGNRAKAVEMFAKLGVIRPEVKRVLDRLEKVPVDIRPEFVTAEQLEAKFAK